MNIIDLQDLEQAGFLGKAAKASLMPMALIHYAVSRAVLGRNSRQLAELLAFGPEGVRRIQELQAGGSPAAIVVALLVVPGGAVDPRSGRLTANRSTSAPRSTPPGLTASGALSLFKPVRPKHGT